MAARRDISILQGKTFGLTIRWESPELVYVPITGIARSAPVNITAPGHGAPDGWRGAVTGAKGMVEINAVANSVRDRDYHTLTVVDANTVQFNDTNSAGFKQYTSGGHLQFYAPVDLTGYTARATVKDRVGGTELFSFTTENGRIAIDTSLCTVHLTASAADTAAFTWRRGVYELEMVSGTGVVTTLAYGAVLVTAEVTT